MVMAERPDKQRDALLVLGMHRSGTSAIALAFGQLGWQLGRDPLDNQPEINRDGFGENRAVVELNEAILSRFGRRWYQLSPLPPGWWKGPEAVDLLEQATEVLEQQYAGTDRLLLKDPRLCLTLPLWLQALERQAISPRVLIASRHPENVAQSLAQRDRLPLQIGYLLWLYHYLCAISYSRGVERRAIRYEDVLSVGADALTVFDDIEMPTDIDLGVDPTLCHHACQEYSEPGELSELCDRVLASLREEDPAGSGLPAADQLLGWLQDETLWTSLDGCLEAMVKYSGQAVEVGQLHSLALDTIRERDEQIEEKSAELEALRTQFLYRVLRKLRMLR